VKDYPNIQQHFDRHLERATDRYLREARRAELRPEVILPEALYKQTLAEARESYTQEALRIRDHNFNVILRTHRRHLQGRRWRECFRCLGINLPLVLAFASVAWYNFFCSGKILLGVIASIGALLLLLMLLLFCIISAQAIHRGKSRDHVGEQEASANRWESGERSGMDGSRKL
jgi:hypothetical protein